MSNEALIVEQEGHVATFTINRPEKRNALNPEIHAGMVEHIDRLSEEGDVRCLVIKGQGDLAFSAGDDLKRAPGDPGPQPTPGKPAELQWPHRKTVQSIFDAPFPVVAMIDGYCVGGGLALATECDIRISTDRAQLGIPPSRLGIIYDYERIQVFIDLVGPAFTKELFCSGLRVDPQRALELPRFLVSSRGRGGDAQRGAVITAEDIIAPSVVRELHSMGHRFQKISLRGEMRMGYGAAVVIQNGEATAGADPRRSGSAKASQQ